MIFTKPPGWSKPPIRYSMFVRSLLLFVSSIAKDNYTTRDFGCQYWLKRIFVHSFLFEHVQRNYTSTLTPSTAAQGKPDLLP